MEKLKLFNMAWFYLILAGFFEIAFATSMKLMNSHKNIPWTIVFYISIVSSFLFLEKAARTLPIGTAYAVWTGIGGTGVAIIGIFFMGDSASPMRIFFIFLLIFALIGLKLTSGH
jgi:quaternary ammonium compound-resistance protein SugE